jgi:hypothetical protein
MGDGRRLDVTLFLSSYEGSAARVRRIVGLIGFICLFAAVFQMSNLTQNWRDSRIEFYRSALQMGRQCYPSVFYVDGSTKSLQIYDPDTIEFRSPTEYREDTRTEKRFAANTNPANLKLKTGQTSTVTKEIVETQSSMRPPTIRVANQGLATGLKRMLHAPDDFAAVSMLKDFRTQLTAQERIKSERLTQSLPFLNLVVDFNYLGSLLSLALLGLMLAFYWSLRQESRVLGAILKVARQETDLVRAVDYIEANQVLGFRPSNLTPWWFTPARIITFCPLILLAFEAYNDVSTFYIGYSVNHYLTLFGAGLDLSIFVISVYVYVICLIEINLREEFLRVANLQSRIISVLLDAGLVDSCEFVNFRSLKVEDEKGWTEKANELETKLSNAIIGMDPGDHTGAPLMKLTDILGRIIRAAELKELDKVASLEQQANELSGLFKKQTGFSVVEFLDRSR